MRPKEYGLKSPFYAKSYLLGFFCQKILLILEQNHVFAIAFWRQSVRLLPSRCHRVVTLTSGRQQHNRFFKVLE